MCVGRPSAPKPPAPPPPQAITRPREANPSVEAAGRDARRRYGGQGRRSTILTMGQSNEGGKTVLGG